MKANPKRVVSEEMDIPHLTCQQSDGVNHFMNIRNKTMNKLTIISYALAALLTMGCIFDSSNSKNQSNSESNASSSSVQTASSSGSLPQSSTNSSSTSNTKILADFENQILSNWSGRNDANGSTITAPSIVASDDPYNGGNYSLNYSYNAKADQIAWGANMGMRSELPQNLSGYDTLKFEIKSTASTILRFQITFEPEGTSGDHYACYEVITTNVWTPITIPLKNLSACWTSHKPVLWDTASTHIYEILWQNSRMESNTISIDNLRLVKPYQSNWLE